MIEDLERDLLELEANENNIKNHLKTKGYKKKHLNKFTKPLEKYDPQIKLLNNVKYVGHQIIRVRINENKFNNNSHFTRDKIQKIANKYSAKLLEKQINGKLSVAMKYGGYGWKSGYLRDIGENPKLYHSADSGVPLFEEPDDISSFVFYIVLYPKNAGGDDDNNDCLYNCLNSYIFNLDKFIKSPEELKKYLKLKRNDKININLIPQIEKKLKGYAINVRGDYIYSSMVKTHKVIDLLLINEHYSIDKNYKNKPVLRNVNYNEKQPLLYDKKTFEGYDGIKKCVLTKEEKAEISYNKTKYIMLYRDEEFNKLTLEEEFIKTIEIHKNLKQASNGLINILKSGSYKNSALDLFDRTTKFIQQPEEIKQDEAVWLKNSTKGALIFADKFEGELYKYDVKSLYPYLMYLSTLKFPIKRGEFQQIITLDELEYFQFGIYRVEIFKSEDDNLNKLFKFNTSHYYTSVDLSNAKKLGFKYKIIVDDKPNFLYYSRDKLITFNEVFKDYIDFMFKLKEQSIPKAKFILNILWGALCEMSRNKYYDNKPVNIGEDEEISELRPCHFDEDVDLIETVKLVNMYKTNYARLAPFLLSNGRKYMSDIMIDYKDDIIRCQTDGFFIKKQLHTNIDVKLGELKYEGYTQNGIIKNCVNKVEIHY